MRTPNPYAANETGNPNPSTSIRRPWLLCGLTTFFAIPAWFFCLIALVSLWGPIDNPAGLPLYMMMCLFMSIFIVPMNVLAVAPALAHLAFPSNGKAVLWHAATAVLAIVLLVGWLAVVARIPWLALTVIPWYLVIMLLPPMLIGSLAYSLRYNAMSRRASQICPG